MATSGDVKGWKRMATRDKMCGTVLMGGSWIDEGEGQREENVNMDRVKKRQRQGRSERDKELRGKK